jgi:hypothetical protein
MGTLDKHGPEKLPMEAVESGERAEATALVPAVCDNIIPIPLITVLDVMDCDDDDELMVPAIAASTITKEHVQVTVHDIVFAPTIDTEPNDINIEVSPNDLMRFPDSDIRIFVPADGPDTVLIPTKLGRPALKLLLPSLSVLLHANQSAHHVSNETALSIQWVEKQTWPPPTQLEPTSMDASIRPMPWPSFLATAQIDELRIEGKLSEAIHIDMSIWLKGNLISCTIPILLTCQLDISSFLNDTCQDRHLWYLYLLCSMDDQLVVFAEKECNDPKGHALPEDNFIKSNIIYRLKGPFEMLPNCLAIVGEKQSVQDST